MRVGDNVRWVRNSAHEKIVAPRVEATAAHVSTKRKIRSTSMGQIASGIRMRDRSGSLDPTRSTGAQEGSHPPVGASLHSGTALGDRVFSVSEEAPWKRCHAIANTN